ncbi:ester cyclase [Deinococcus pimensis]|uniref:ester cyclase n=1 Tax=Deinococcus pimensis TaxID=309888 RepID=UPI0004B79A6C|nr:ester cyclase [Deinococcus pimensis]
MDTRTTITDTALVDAFNRADWTAFVGTLTPDMTYEEPATGRAVQGAQAYARLCMGWREALPDVRGTVTRSLRQGDTLVQEVVWTGTHTGNLETPGGSIPPTGRRIEVMAVLWCDLEGDRIRFVRHHLDVMTMMTQIGVTSTPR